MAERFLKVIYIYIYHDNTIRHFLRYEKQLLTWSHFQPCLKAIEFKWNLPKKTSFSLICIVSYKAPCKQQLHNQWAEILRLGRECLEDMMLAKATTMDACNWNSSQSINLSSQTLSSSRKTV